MQDYRQSLLVLVEGKEKVQSHYRRYRPFHLNNEQDELVLEELFHQPHFFFNNSKVIRLWFAECFLYVRVEQFCTNFTNIAVIAIYIFVQQVLA